MIEILVSGDVKNDFNRLNIVERITYGSNKTEFKIYEVTKDEFNILCNEPEIKDTWEDGGWRYCEGSTFGYSSDPIIINNKTLKGWHGEFREDWEEDERVEYNDLLEYLCDELGVSSFKNVYAVSKDLAKYNNMKMSELFELYQN